VYKKTDNFKIKKRR